MFVRRKQLQHLFKRTSAGLLPASLLQQPGCRGELHSFARSRSDRLTRPAAPEELGGGKPLQVRFSQAPTGTRLQRVRAAPRTRLGCLLLRAPHSIHGTSRGPVPACPPKEKGKRSGAQNTNRGRKFEHREFSPAPGKADPRPQPPRFPPTLSRGSPGCPAPQSSRCPSPPPPPHLPRAPPCPRPPAPLTGRLGRRRRPRHAVQVEDGEQVGLRFLQGHPQVLEVVPLLGQQQGDEQLGLPAARRLQVAQVAGTEGAGGLQQLHHLVHLGHGLRQALAALGEQLLVLRLHGRGRPPPAKLRPPRSRSAAAPRPRRSATAALGEARAEGGHRRPPSSGNRRTRSGPRRNFVPEKRRGARAEAGPRAALPLSPGREAPPPRCPSGRQRSSRRWGCCSSSSSSGRPSRSFPPPRAAKQLLLFPAPGSDTAGSRSRERAAAAAFRAPPTPPRGSPDNFSLRSLQDTRPRGEEGVGGNGFSSKRLLSFPGARSHIGCTRLPPAPRRSCRSALPARPLLASRRRAAPAASASSPAAARLPAVSQGLPRPRAARRRGAGTRAERAEPGGTRPALLRYVVPRLPPGAERPAGASPRSSLRGSGAWLGRDG